LEIIESYSIFRSDEAIVDEFAKIEGATGTRIIIYNLKGSFTDNYEFDFSNPHDLTLIKEEKEAYGAFTICYLNVTEVTTMK
jgi:hypothetical protein